MPPAQAGTALAERAGEAGHHERDRGAAGHPHRSTPPRSRMEGHTTVPELGHGSPLRLENGIGVGRRWSARRVSGGGVAGSGRDRGRAFRRSAAVRRGHGDLRGGDQRGLRGVESGSQAEASAGLAALWGELRIDRVMRTDAVSLFSIGTRWLRDLTLGGLLKPDARSNHLLDTTPLREFLIANIDFEAIARHIASDILHGFAVSATSYTTGTAVTFFDGHDAPEPCTRSARLGWRARIGLDHVLASASHSILFRPVFVEGAFYRDGGAGMATPLTPAVHLGPDRVVGISRYLTRGIGASPERGADFVSYLAFDPSYTRPLIEIGPRDAVAQKDEIEAFFSSRPATCTPAAGGRHAS